jgi:arylsulfatase B
MKILKQSIIIASILIIASLLSCSKDTEEVEKTEETEEVVNISSSPNIILLIGDDLGWDAIGNYPGISSTKANTPTLDSLARNGVTFNNYWVNPVCAPTRAATITGKYAFRTGVGSVQTPPTAVLNSSETIIHKYIKDKTSNSYATALIGKWHLSAASDLNAPENFGVDYFSGIMLGAVSDYFDWTETSGGTQQDITTYTTTHFVNQSVDWIQQQSKPFFLWLAFNAPHTPFHRPPLNLISDQSLSNNMAEINSNPLPYYLASIEAMDKEIARLIASLTPDQKENTVFVFMGDNGTPGDVAQAPFTRLNSKGTLYQGGVNAPLIICGKDISRTNEVETALVQAQDMFATLADLAGAGSENYEDGISIKPLLNDANATKRSYLYTELFASTNTRNDGEAIRNLKYKYIQLDNQGEGSLLYDLSADPFEQNDLMTGNLSEEAQENFNELKAIKDGIN